MAHAKLNNAIRLIALVILLGVGVYIFILSTSEDGAGLREKISQLSIGYFIVPIALSLTSYLLRFVRWRIILRAMGHSLSVRVDFIYYLSGFALTMTPGKSGETIRSAFLLQANVPVQTSLSAFIIERSFDLLVVAMLGTSLFIHPAVSLILFSAALALVVLLGIWFGYPERHRYKINRPKFILRLFHTLRQASDALRPRLVIAYALLGCAAWVAQGISFYYIVSLFPNDIEVFKAINTYCAGLFVGAVSLIPGGIGVTEGSLSWLLQSQGLDQNSAILSALLSRGCTLWLAVTVGCAGLIAIVKGKIVSNK